MSEKEKKATLKSAETKQDKPKKDKSKEPKQSKIKKWFTDLKSEVKKVIWPTKKVVVHNSGVVLATVVFSVMLISGMDFLFKFVYEALIKLG